MQPITTLMFSVLRGIDKLHKGPKNSSVLGKDNREDPPECPVDAGLANGQIMAIIWHKWYSRGKEEEDCTKAGWKVIWIPIKEGSLSCFDLQNHGAFCCTLGTIGKPLMTRGAPNWFQIFDLGWKSYWTLNIFFTKISSKSKLKIMRNLVGVIRKHWVIGFNKGELKYFRPKVHEILNFG